VIVFYGKGACPAPGDAKNAEWLNHADRRHEEWRDERSQSQLFLDLFNSREEFPEPMNPGNLLLCFRKRHGGRRPPSPPADVLGDATLRPNHSFVTDFDMANNTNLTRYRDAFADTRAA
jgi:hypothetical protein